MQRRKKYTQEFKQEAVNLVRRTTSSVREIAMDLDINPSTLCRWCRVFKQDGDKAFHGQGKPRDAEVAALKRELAKVKKEQDFLREAAAFFARESK